MTCFLTISIGKSADSARPLLASTNQALVRHAIRGFFHLVDRDDRGETQLPDLPHADGAGEYQWSQCDIDFELERADAIENVALADGESGTWDDETRALAAWHRERARAIALLVQQRDLAVKVDPDGVPFLADSNSDGAPLSVRVSSDGVPYLAESSKSTPVAAEG
ncbi:MAG TPA: hypothetical protein VGH98_09340 [Gemmatimonadaceae bacterium]|jgi:hypothetical protein